MEEERNKPKKTFIPRSIIQLNKFKGFNKQNWIEAIIFGLFTFCIVATIPFIPIIKIVSCIVLGGSVFYFNLIGIRNRSFTQIVFATIRHYKRRKYYILRRMKDETEKFDNTSRIGKATFAEKISNKFQDVAESIEKYRKY